MKKIIITLLAVVMILSLTLTTYAYNNEFYDEEHGWLFDYGTKDGFTYEVYIPPMDQGQYQISFYVDSPTKSILTLVLQSVVTYDDYSIDLSIDYGVMHPVYPYAEVTKYILFNQNKTVISVDFDCHIYTNGIYQTTLGIHQDL